MFRLCNNYNNDDNDDDDDDDVIDDSLRIIHNVNACYDDNDNKVGNIGMQMRINLLIKELCFV